jgi:hypothetical protein
MFSSRQIFMRVEALRRELAYQSAKTLLDTAKSKIPKTDEYARYRDALRLYQHGSSRHPDYAVLGLDPKTDTVEKTTDIIYFKGRKGRSLSPAVEILMKYQPWTQETLPFAPEPREARMVVRRVSTREVRAVTEMRNKDRPRWTKELAQVGAPTSNKLSPAKPTSTLDLVYMALRLEFGIGGTRAVAHWRPAIVASKRTLKELFDDGFAAQAFDWRNVAWKRWLSRASPKVPEPEVESASGFEDKFI